MRVNFGFITSFPALVSFYNSTYGLVVQNNNSPIEGYIIPNKTIKDNVVIELTSTILLLDEDNIDVEFQEGYCQVGDGRYTLTFPYLSNYTPVFKFDNIQSSKFINVESNNERIIKELVNTDKVLPESVDNIVLYNNKLIVQNSEIVLEVNVGQTNQIFNGIYNVKDMLKVIKRDYTHYILLEPQEKIILLDSSTYSFIIIDFKRTEIDYYFNNFKCISTINNNFTNLKGKVNRIMKKKDVLLLTLTSKDLLFNSLDNNITVHNVSYRLEDYVVLTRYSNFILSSVLSLMSNTLSLEVDEINGYLRLGNMLILRYKDGRG